MTLFYLTTRVTTSLRLFGWTVDSTELAAIPICRQQRPRILVNVSFLFNVFK
jgi:hypothetical protein